MWPTGEASAQWREGVAGDRPGPDELPEGVGELGIRPESRPLDLGGPGAVRQHREVHRSTSRESGAQRLRLLTGGLGGVVHGEVGGLGDVQRHPAVVAGERPVPLPEHLARGHEVIEQARLVVAHAGGQDDALEGARWEHRPGELLDRPQHPGPAPQ